MSAAVRSFILVLSLVFFALNCWFLYYIDHLQKKGCKCAESWRRSFMEFMLAVYVVLFLVGLIFPINHILVGFLLIAYAILVVTYIVITRQFIDLMSESNCTCATDSEAFWWLGFINIINIVVLFIIVLFALIGILFLSPARSSPARFTKRR